MKLNWYKINVVNDFEIASKIRSLENKKLRNKKLQEINNKIFNKMIISGQIIYCAYARDN